MLLDAEPGGDEIEAGLAAHLAGATPGERVFLSRTNRQWIDGVVYASWMMQRLLQAHQAGSAVLGDFGLGQAEVISSAGGVDHANVMLLVRAPGARFAVRVYGPDAGEASVRSEVYWTERLGFAISANVPRHLSGGDGSTVQIARTDSGERLCTACEWLPGRRLAEVAGGLDGDAVTGLGRALAEMHACGTEPEVPDWFERPTYGVATTAGAEGLAADDPLMRRLEACPQAFGLIHRELGHHNILIDDEAGISFIDFTTLGWGWFVHDIGTVVGDLPRSMWDGFFEGYASVRSLTETELAWIDTRLA